MVVGLVEDPIEGIIADVLQESWKESENEEKEVADDRQTHREDEDQRSRTVAGEEESVVEDGCLIPFFRHWIMVRNLVIVACSCHGGNSSVLFQLRTCTIHDDVVVFGS